jgi:hypothetical protein
MGRTTSLVIVALMVIAVASLALNAYQYSSTKTVTETTTTEVTTTEITTELVTTSYTCIISGQPGGIFLRVLSDSTSQPVSGVVVTAVNTPFQCDGSPATTKTVDMFTTNGTEWLSLPSDNNYQYFIIANYQGHTFTFTATLRPVSETCATLYVPSGRTNTTITEFGNGC